MTNNDSSVEITRGHDLAILIGSGQSSDSTCCAMATYIMSSQYGVYFRSFFVEADNSSQCTIHPHDLTSEVTSRT